MFNAQQAYRVLTLALALLSLLAPSYVQASLSHRTTLPFPDRAQHAERHGLSTAQRDQDLNSNLPHTPRVGARDVGKAAAARRWVGASPTQTNDGDVAAISVFTRPAQRLKAEYGKGGRLLKKREWTFEYDARGRRIAKVRTLAGVEERTEYEWDGRDKLRTVRKPDGTRLDYSYDVFGRRVSKTRSGGPLDDKRVEYVWDGEVLAWELDSEKGPRTFVHEPSGFEPILQQQGGETYLCVNDHLGMPKELIDGAGNLAWAGAHSAYGAVIATDGSGEVEVEGGFVSGGPRVESPFRLLGQVHDEDAELSWTRFRCFDAETGTWISTDPLEINGGLNLYGFDGSPSDVVDPLGLTTDNKNHYPDDFTTANTVNRSAQFNSERDARNTARTALGRDAVEIDPGKWRSQDGRWQYRAKPNDLRGHGESDSPHVHLERLNQETGEVLENWHFRW